MKNQKFSAFLVSVTIILAVLSFFVWETPATAEPPRYGGTLTRINSFTTGNVIGVPWKMSGPNPQLWLPTTDTLLMQDGQGRIQPYLATSWDIASDHLSITFNLRNDVKFHDGTDFNAKAVKWMWDKQIENKSVGTSAWKSADVIDEYTVRLNLKKWDASVLNTIALVYNNMGFISPTAYEKNGEEWCNTHPISTGPFKIESFDPASGAVYVKNENYWQKGKPYIDKLVFTVIQDPMAAALALRKGDAQIMAMSRGAYMETKAQLIKAGFEMVPYDHGMGVYALFPDSAHADSPVANQTLREAIEYAIDKKGICQALGFGIWKPTNQVTNSSSMAYNPGLVGRNYDVQKAKSLLAKAGYSPNELSLNLYCLAGDANLAQALQANLKAIGINLEIQVIDNATQAKIISNGWNNGLFLSAIGSTSYWTAAVARYYTSPTQYAATYRSDAVKEALSESQSALDYDSAKAAMQKIARITQEEAMIIPLFEHDPDWIINPDIVKNPGFHVGGQWDLPNLWLKK